MDLKGIAVIEHGYAKRLRGRHSNTEANSRKVAVTLMAIMLDIRNDTSPKCEVSFRHDAAGMARGCDVQLDLKC